GTPGAFAGSGAVYTLNVIDGVSGQTQTVNVPDGAAIATIGGLASTADSKEIVLAKTGADLVVGNYIKFGSYTAENSTTHAITNTPIIWRVINKTDINSDGTQDLMLLSDRIITMKPYDALDAAEADANRKLNGSNSWLKSNIREWLNSTAGANSVAYSTQKPDAAHVWVSGTAVNPYSAEAGFLNTNNFTATETGKILSVPNKSIIDFNTDAPADGGSVEHGYVTTGVDESVAAGTNYTTAYYKNTTDKVFLPSLGELATYVDGETSLGTDYQIGYTTQQARDQSNYESDPANDTTAWYYWTRDAYTAGSYDVRDVRPDGAVDAGSAFVGYHGVRPALYLSESSMTLDGASGLSAENAMTITWN
ncbi:MAG TPA: hypothetical protein DCP90_08745, partial [Clostridiales bacterium]|nr:hypothetical protein [Clostridiales bacterium]